VSQARSSPTDAPSRQTLFGIGSTQKMIFAGVKEASQCHDHASVDVIDHGVPFSQGLASHRG